MLICLSMLWRGSLVSSRQKTPKDCSIQKKTRLVLCLEWGGCCTFYGLDLLSLFERSPDKQCTALIWEVQNALFGSGSRLSWTHLNDVEPRHSTIIEVHFWPAFMLCGRQLSGSSSLAVNKWQAIKHCPCRCIKKTLFSDCPRVASLCQKKEQMLEALKHNRSLFYFVVCIFLVWVLESN